MRKLPDLILENEFGNEVNLKSYEGNITVIFFYPKDMTPGCTTEACDFRDSYELLQSKDVKIVGISPDSKERHQKFIEKNSLPYNLLCDIDHKAAEAFDVWKLKKNFGNEYMGIERSTFLFNPNGELIKEWRKVKVKGHVTEIIEEIIKTER